jgi:4-amino-4-deoxychorismate lyase
VESAFCEPIPADCRLIETFRYDPSAGAVDLDLHLNRMCDAARKLGFSFRRKDAEHLCGGLSSPASLRCRLTLTQEGQFDLQTHALGVTASQWVLGVSDRRLRSDDPWLAHKTTERRLYDETRAALPVGIDEILFLNEKDELCEGTITNVFVQCADQTWVTPPISSGCLPGILRQNLIVSRKVRVKVVTLDDLRQAVKIRVGNSLRGLIDAKLAPDALKSFGF